MIGPSVLRELRWSSSPIEKYSTYRDRLGALIFFIENRAKPQETLFKAVKYLIDNHGASEVPPVSGWPIVRLPDPEDKNSFIELAVVVVDVQSR
jgi:hypothetical protein